MRLTRDYLNMNLLNTSHLQRPLPSWSSGDANFLLCHLCQWVILQFVFPSPLRFPSHSPIWRICRLQRSVLSSLGKCFTDSFTIRRHKVLRRFFKSLAKIHLTFLFYPTSQEHRSFLWFNSQQLKNRRKSKQRVSISQRFSSTSFPNRKSWKLPH